MLKQELVRNLEFLTFMVRLVDISLNQSKVDLVAKLWTVVSSHLGAYQKKKSQEVC